MEPEEEEENLGCTGAEAIGVPSGPSAVAVAAAEEEEEEEAAGAEEEDADVSMSIRSNLSSPTHTNSTIECESSDL